MVPVVAVCSSAAVAISLSCRETALMSLMMSSGTLPEFYDDVAPLPSRRLQPYLFLFCAKSDDIELVVATPRRINLYMAVQIEYKVAWYEYRRRDGVTGSMPAIMGRVE
jgi:hypothetical protein